MNSTISLKKLLTLIFKKIKQNKKLIFTVTTIIIVIFGIFMLFSFLFQSEKNISVNSKTTVDFLINEIDNIFNKLQNSKEIIEINLWNNFFYDFTKWASKINYIQKEINETISLKFRNLSLDILDKLLNETKVIEFFPITEKIKLMSNIHKSVATLSKQLNFVKTVSSSKSHFFHFQTSNFFSNEDITFEFENKLSIKIFSKTFSNLDSDNVFVTAVLFKNMANYFSFDYPINSNIFAVIYENESITNQDIEFSLVIFVCVF